MFNIVDNKRLGHDGMETSFIKYLCNNRQWCMC